VFRQQFVGALAKRIFQFSRQHR